MLDQNTDRMWYVIGAILIGAAILFGFNALVPSAFASVGDSMGSIAEVVERKVYDLSPKVGTKHWVEDYLNNTENWYQGGILSDGTDSGNEHAVLTGYVEIEPGEYSIEYSVDDVKEHHKPDVVYAVYSMGEVTEDGHKVLIERGSDIPSGHRFVIEEPSYFRVRIAYQNELSERKDYIKDALFADELNKWSFKVQNYVLKEGR